MLSLLFSLFGRIPRKTYWLGLLGIMVAMIVAVMVAAMALGPVIGSDPANYSNPETMLNVIRHPVFMALMAVYLLFIWFSLAITVKRLHDRGWSGWWLAVPYVIYAVPAAYLYMTGGYNPMALGPQGQPVAPDPILLTVLGVAGLLSTIVSLWLFIVVGFLRGTEGPNRFGPDPLGGTAQAGLAPEQEWAS